MFGRANGASSARIQENQQGHHLLHQQQQRHALGVPTPPPGQVSGKFSPFAPHESPVLHQQRQVQSQGSRPRTLHEIEEEMLLMAAAQAKQREREAEEQHRQQQQQFLLLRHQQQELQRQEEERQLLELQQLQQQKEQERLYEQQQYQRLLQFQQQQQHQQQRTPPPRMLPVAQSPRFLEHQRQQASLLLQQERQRQLLLQEQERQQQLQERRERQIRQLLEQEELQRRMAQATLEERLHWQQQEAQALAAEHQHRSFNTPSPARHVQQQGRVLPGSLGRDSPNPNQQNIQLQQRLLAELAQSEFPQIPGRQPASQEQLRAEAMRRIMETEREEEKRRRKAHKIASMVSGFISSHP